MSQWKQVNREKINEQSRRRREGNPDAARENERRWATANPDKVRVKGHRQRARKKEATVVPVTVEQVVAKLSMWGNRCWMCGGAFDSVDHVKPLAKGGAHVLANLRPACRSCNAKKNARWYGVAELHRFVVR